VQSPATVGILQETIHDVRVVPLDQQRRLPSTIRQWHGDSRGHWDGDTLVVDTVGPDHVLYGSDAPPLTSLKPRAIKLVEGLRASDEDREKIFWRNAAKLLQLDVQGVG